MKNTINTSEHFESNFSLETGEDFITAMRSLELAHAAMPTLMTRNRTQYAAYRGLFTPKNLN